VEPSSYEEFMKVIILILIIIIIIIIIVNNIYATIALTAVSFVVSGQWDIQLNVKMLGKCTILIK
jgi:hypothetical protein